MNEPWMIALSGLVALFVFKLWRDDLAAWKRGEAKPGGIPGATPANAYIIALGIVGALLLVGLETTGEYVLGTVSEQTTAPAIALIAWIGAGVVEEVVFRGFLVVPNKGRGPLVASIVGFSLIFALLHVQYYLHWEEEAAWHDFSWALDGSAAWSLLILFLNSLWFYTLRFHPRNPHRSLLPCFLAHISSNVAVFVVKLSQGYIVGLY